MEQLQVFTTGGQRIPPDVSSQYKYKNDQVMVAVVVAVVVTVVVVYYINHIMNMNKNGTRVKRAQERKGGRWG